MKKKKKLIKDKYTLLKHLKASGNKTKEKDVEIESLKKIKLELLDNKNKKELLTKQLNDLEQKIQQKRDEIEKCNDNITKLRSMIKKLTKENQTYQQRIIVETNKSKTCNKKIIEYTEELQRLRSQKPKIDTTLIKEKEAKIAELKELKKTLEAKIAALIFDKSNFNETLEKTKLSSNKKFQDKLDECKILESEDAKLKQELLNLKAELSQLKEQKPKIDTKLIEEKEKKNTRVRK